MPEDALLRWEPPPDWVEVSRGVYQPHDYARSAWELATPEVLSARDAAVDLSKCEQSLAYFALTHCWTLDVDSPDGEPRWRKFPAYRYLREFFAQVQEPRLTLVEKSRRMTLTWSWMATFLWDILFHDNWSDLCISMLDTLVDDGGQASTPNSMLGMVRAMHAHLPAHAWQPFSIRKGLIRNAARGSYIRGQAGTVRAGRGTGFKRALMDEASRIMHGESVFQSMRQVSQRGLSLNATPAGKGDVFARIRFNPHSTFTKLTYHWSRHPRYAAGLYCAGCEWRAPSGLPPETALAQFSAHPCANPREKFARSPWYDEVGKDMTPEQVASELDISYEHSRSGRVFFTFDATRHVIDHTQFVDPATRLPVGERIQHESLERYRHRVLRASLVPHHQPVVAWDFGVGDPTWMILGQVDDEASMEVRWLDAFWSADKSYDFFARIVNEVWLPAWREVGGPSFYDLAHYGDPSGRNRQSDLRSWISNLGSEPWNVTVQWVEQREAGSKLAWLALIREELRRDHVRVSTFVPRLVDAFEQYHFPVDEQGRPVPGSQEPVHDEWSHPMDAMRYVYQARWTHRLHLTVEEGSASHRDVLSRGGGGTLYDRREF